MTVGHCVLLSNIKEEGDFFNNFKMSRSNPCREKRSAVVLSLNQLFELPVTFHHLIAKTLPNLKLSR